jgi:hypothetical protein
MKYFIGPMSKNVTDTIIEYVNEYNIEIVFIPSRRQIEFNGGYVNEWTTENFCKYVKEKSYGNILIQRDHGGPGQGYIEDDGYESLDYDCQLIDLIHIDPWKKYPVYADGLKWTIEILNYCYNKNPNLQFEIGTEEGIRPFSEEELDIFLNDITSKVSLQIRKQIKYVVIQCGTSLKDKINTGRFNSSKLKNMLSIVEKHGFEAKEHNGDWVDMDIIKEKESIGLKNINIAPEFGEIETRVLLNEIEKNENDFERLYTLCYNSGRWKKWVTSSFIPEENKKLLILICGHYVFSDKEFIELKSQYTDIDYKIKEAIKYKLHMLNNIYYERKECIICRKNEFETFFEKNYSASLSFALFEMRQPSYFMPFNVIICNECKTVQTKYLGNPSIIYSTNHIDAFGTTKKTMHNLFAKFISDNNNITGIIEVGACTDTLARSINEIKKIPYTIIDPDFKGDPTNITVISNLIENTELTNLNANTIIMSNLFEHLYDPTSILEKCYKDNIKYIYINDPNFENGCKSNKYIILNIEHIYYYENEFLNNLFHKYGYSFIKKDTYDDHSLFLMFERQPTMNKELKITNINSYNDVKLFYSVMSRRIDKLNKLFENKERKYYMWPAASFIISLFVYGLQYERIAGILDNSPNKIGKILYGYNIHCFDFNKIINSPDDSITIILGGSSNYKNELLLNDKKVELIFLDDL